jgi:hypothetical protein
MHQCRDAVIARIGRVVARRADDAEEGVAMLLALMVILMLLTISITVAGVTLSQVKPSQLDRKTTVTESAAEAGFDIALNRIRAANTGVLTLNPNTDTYYLPGTSALLPCSASGPTITGAVNDGSATDSLYSVTLVYYDKDPTLPGATKINCNGSKPASVPGFVQITSIGSAKDVAGTRVGSGNRVLQTVYALQTNNANTPGGEIPFYSDLTLCFAVSDAVNTVQVGDKLTVATCDPSVKDSRQLFSYTPTLELAVTATNGATLCLQGAATVHVVPTLQPCSLNPLPAPAPLAPPWTLSTQVWSYNDNGQFEASNTSDTGLVSNICLNLYAGSPGSIAGLAAGDFVDVDTCGAQMVPTAKVGAGAAGTALRLFQLTNYQYFGRCIDDTNQSVLATWLIGYPCKQDPLATNLTWNQVYYTGVSGGDGGTTTTESASNGGGAPGNTVISTPPVYNSSGVLITAATGCQISNVTPCQLITFPNGAGGATKDYYCLEAGNAPNPAAPVNGTIVTVQPCSTTDHYQQWTYTQKYVSNYLQQYLIQPYGASVSNLCLTMTIGSTPPGLTYDSAHAGGTPIPAYGYIDVETCNSKPSPFYPDLSQKWNAPPLVNVNQLKNTLELPNP